MNCLNRFILSANVVIFLMQVKTPIHGIEDLD